MVKRASVFPPSSYFNTGRSASNNYYIAIIRSLESGAKRQIGEIEKFSIWCFDAMHKKTEASEDAGLHSRCSRYSLVEKRGSGLAPYQPVAVALPLMPSW